MDDRAFHWMERNPRLLEEAVREVGVEALHVLALHEHPRARVETRRTILHHHRLDQIRVLQLHVLTLLPWFLGHVWVAPPDARDKSAVRPGLRYRLTYSLGSKFSAMVHTAALAPSMTNSLTT